VLIILVHMTGRIFIFFLFSFWSILVVPLSAQYVSIFDTSVYHHDRPSVHTKNFDLSKTSDELGTQDPLTIQLGLSTDDASQDLLDKPSPNTPNDSFSNLLLRRTDSLNSANSSVDEFVCDYDSEQWCIPEIVSNSDGTYERAIDENLIPQISALLDNFIKIGGSSFGYFTLPVGRYHYDTPDLISLSHDYHYALTDRLLSHADSFFYHSTVASASNKTNEFSEADSSIFSFRPESLYAKYPNFSFIRYSPPQFTFNAFLENPFVPINKDLTSPSAENSYLSSIRERRVAWYPGDFYSWELNDFDPSNSAANPNVVFSINADENITEFDVNSLPDKNTNKIYLEVNATGGISSIDILAYGVTGGNALNDYNNTSGFLLMTATGWDADGNPSQIDNLDVSDYFTLHTTSPFIDSESGDTGIDNWLNGYDSSNAWGVWKSGDDFYLTYTFSDLNFSPVPEPSTYFMTGALFCLIGLNRTSRNSMKKLLFLFLVKFSRNYNAREVEKKVS